jgi:zinc protease
MNTLLGGSFTSRLNDNLREQHGYAYGAGSTFGYRKVAGLFLAAADVQTPSTAPALGEFLKELERIRTPATPEEVERARGYLAYGYAGDFETTRQIAARIADRVIYDLPEDALETFVPRVLAVGPREVASAAREHVDAGSLAIVVVGDRKAVEPGLRALGIAQVKTLTVDEVMGPPPTIE